ncbi:MAG: hypothetical protein WKF88_04870 [Ferruginibacter sp.]
MKKFIAIFFLTVYGITSMGATVYTHYCMNQFAGTDLWHNDKCGKCGMTEDEGKGCCKDEKKVYKITADQNLSVSQADHSVFQAPAIVPHVLAYKEIVFIAMASPYPANHAPPDIGISRNILHCIFRI